MSQTGPVRIHLIVPDANGPIQSGGLSPVGGLGAVGPARYSVACRPTARLPPHATGETSAVTCEACKASQAFQLMAAKQAPLGDGLVDADPEDFPQGCDGCENGAK
ncbi:MAG: hypothetical protein IT428_19840 [Planctomycetaceae bacterium]|nr:hypothetical protein [Planctomycetaceae bacterium]